ncbi:WXG100 family type VII secretion target [Streptomyces sp. NPDC059991]|uniref:WXG100 family type VII secretion target n=1 Tax=unclassified Streptomyces TaxID=2593676 RepID=UPI0036CEDEE5
MSSNPGGQSIGYEAVTKAKNAIEETAHDMSQQIRVLADAIATVGAGWSGSGANQFVTAQDTLNRRHDDIRRKLDVLYNAVIGTKNLNQENDEEVDAAFRAINAEGGAASGGVPNTSSLNSL